MLRVVMLEVQVVLKMADMRVEGVLLMIAEE